MDIWTKKLLYQKRIVDNVFIRWICKQVLQIINQLSNLAISVLAILLFDKIVWWWLSWSESSNIIRIYNYRIRAYRTPAFYQNFGFSGCAQWSFLANFCPKQPWFWRKSCKKWPRCAQIDPCGVLINSCALYTRIRYLCM